MKQITLYRIYQICGAVSIFAVAGIFFIEDNSLNIQNDDQLSMVFLIIALIFNVLFLSFLTRKIHVYGSTTLEKIGIGLGIALLLFLLFGLLFMLTFDLSMV